YRGRSAPTFVRSAREDRAGTDAGGAVDLRVAHARVARNLARAGVAPQLEADLVDLPKARRADRLAVGDQPAVGVDRQAAADLRLAILDHPLLVAVGAEAVLGHVHDLGAGLRVLDLCDLYVLGPDAGHLVARPRRVDRRRRRALDRHPGRHHLERPAPACPQCNAAHVN